MFFYTYDQYWWKTIGNSEFKGPFDSIPLAILDYETYLYGVAKVFSDSPNVIRVDFFSKKRAK